MRSSPRRMELNDLAVKSLQIKFADMKWFRNSLWTVICFLCMGMQLKSTSFYQQLPRHKRRESRYVNSEDVWYKYLHHQTSPTKRTAPLETLTENLRKIIYIGKSLHWLHRSLWNNKIPHVWGRGIKTNGVGNRGFRNSVVWNVVFTRLKMKRV